MGTLYDELVRQSVELTRNPLAPLLLNQEREIRDNRESIASARSRIAKEFDAKIEEGVRTRLMDQDQKFRLKLSDKDHEERMKEIALMNKGRLDVKDAALEWTPEERTRRFYELENKKSDVLRGAKAGLTKAQQELAAAKLSAAQRVLKQLDEFAKPNNPKLTSGRWGSEEKAIIKRVSDLKSLSPDDLIATLEDDSPEIQTLLGNAGASNPFAKSKNGGYINSSLAEKDAAVFERKADIESEDGTTRAELSNIARQQMMIERAGPLLPDKEGKFIDIFKPKTPGDDGVQQPPPPPGTVPPPAAPPAAAPAATNAPSATVPRAWKPSFGPASSSVGAPVITPPEQVVPTAPTVNPNFVARPPLFKAFQSDPLGGAGDILKQMGVSGPEIAEMAKDAATLGPDEINNIAMGLQQGHPDVIAGFNEYRAQIQSRLAQTSQG